MNNKHNVFTKLLLEDTRIKICKRYYWYINTKIRAKLVALLHGGEGITDWVCTCVHAWGNQYTLLIG